MSGLGTRRGSAPAPGGTYPRDPGALARAAFPPHRHAAVNLARQALRPAARWRAGDGVRGPCSANNSIEVRGVRADQVADAGTRETGSLHEASGIGDPASPCPLQLLSFSRHRAQQGSRTPAPESSDSLILASGARRTNGRTHDAATRSKNPLIPLASQAPSAHGLLRPDLIRGRSQYRSGRALDRT
jgi:hypothetical protein